MAKYLMGSDGKIAAKIVEKSEKKEPKKYLMGSDGKIAAEIKSRKNKEEDYINKIWEKARERATWTVIKRTAKRASLKKK